VEYAGAECIESLLCATVQAVGGVLPQIACRGRKKKDGFEMECNLSEAWALRFWVLLVGSDARDPARPADGDELDRCRHDGKRVKSVTLKTGERYRYYKVFLNEPDPLKRVVELVNPPLSERKVDWW
jgi:hypothetical protein